MMAILERAKRFHSNSLMLGGMLVQPEDAALLAAALVQMPHLASLNIQGQPVHVSVEGVLSVIGDTHITYLNASRNSVCCATNDDDDDDDGDGSGGCDVTSGDRRWPRVEEVDLHRCNLRSFAVHCARLRVLDLSWNETLSVLDLHLGGSMGSSLLTTLNVSHCAIGDGDMLSTMLLSLSECSNCLRQLDASNNCITGHSCLHLRLYLASEHCVLQELDLSFNNLTDDGTIVALPDAIARATTLVKLCLRQCQLHNADMAGVLDAVKDNRTLEYLDLSSNPTAAYDGEALCRCISVNRRLVELNLRRNSLSKKMINPLKRAIASNTCITLLTADTAFFPLSFKTMLSTNALAREECRRAALFVIGIKTKRFNRCGVLKRLPADLVTVIAKMVWSTRGEACWLTMGATFSTSEETDSEDWNEW